MAETSPAKKGPVFTPRRHWLRWLPPADQLPAPNALGRLRAHYLPAIAPPTLMRSSWVAPSKIRIGPGRNQDLAAAPFLFFFSHPRSLARGKRPASRASTRHHATWLGPRILRAPAPST